VIKIASKRMASVTSKNSTTTTQEETPTTGGDHCQQQSADAAAAAAVTAERDGLHNTSTGDGCSSGQKNMDSEVVVDDKKEGLSEGSTDSDLDLSEDEAAATTSSSSTTSSASSSSKSSEDKATKKLKSKVRRMTDLERLDSCEKYKGLGTSDFHQKQYAAAITNYKMAVNYIVYAKPPPASRKNEDGREGADLGMSVEGKNQNCSTSSNSSTSGDLSSQALSSNKANDSNSSDSTSFSSTNSNSSSSSSSGTLGSSGVDSSNSSSTTSVGEAGSDVDVKARERELQVSCLLNVCMCHLKLGEWFSAIKAAEEVTCIAPDNVKVLVTFLRLLRRKRGITALICSMEG